MVDSIHEEQFYVLWWTGNHSLRINYCKNIILALSYYCINVKYTLNKDKIATQPRWKET